MNPLELIPMPFAGSAAYVAAAVGILLGAALVVWGRVLGRPLAMVMLAAVGYAAGAPLAAAISSWTGVNIPPGLVQIILSVVGFVLGFIAERIIWGALAGALVALPILVKTFASAAATTGGAPGNAQHAQAPHGDTFMQYLQSALANFKIAWDDHWQADSTKLLLIVAIPLAVCLVLAFVRPRLVRIIMATLLGAAALVVGLVLALSQMVGWMWEWNWRQIYLPLAVILVIAIVGIIMQIRTSLKLDAQEREREESAKKTKADAEKKANRLAN